MFNFVITIKNNKYYKYFFADGQDALRSLLDNLPSSVRNTISEQKIVIKGSKIGEPLRT